MRLHLVVLTILFIAVAVALPTRTVKLAISVSTQTASSFLNTNGKAVLGGLEFFAQRANGWNITADNQTIQFTVTHLEDYGNSSIVVENYKTFLADASVDYMFGPVTSPLSRSAKSVTEPAKRLLIGTKVGSQSFYSGADYSFSVTTSPPRYATTTLPEFRINKIKKIIVVVEQTPFQIDIGNGFVVNGKDYDVTVVKPLLPVLSDTLNGVDDAFIKNITDTVKMVRDMDTPENEIDAVAVMSFSNVGKQFLIAMRDLDYTPKAIYISALFIPDFQTYDPELTAYVSGCDVMAPGINFFDPYFTSYSQFIDDYNAANPGANADANHAIGAVAGELLAIAIKNAKTLDNGEVTKAFSRLNEETFYGPMQFASDHAQLRFVPLLQFVPESKSWTDHALTRATTNFTNNIVVIGPSRVQVDDFVYPIPTWSERIYNPQIEASEWAMFALAIAGSVFSIVLMIYIAVHRNNKVIRGSSALFLGYLLFGTLLSYASIFTGNLNAVSVGTCVLTPLFLGIGFTITFGSLFAKSWRIHSLYNDKTLTIRAITDLKLTIITAVVVAVEVVICIIIAIFGSDVVLVVTDPHRPSLWYQSCNVDMILSPVSWSFVIIALGYNAVVMAYGVYLAIRIRSVPHKVYNESRQLAFVIYALVVLAALIVALQFVPSINRVEKYVIRSVGIVVANLTTIIVIIGNKLHMMRRLKSNGDESFRSDRSLNMTSVNTNSGDTTKLEQENEELRKEVEKLKAELSAVKKQQQQDDNSSEARPEV